MSHLQHTLLGRLTKCRQLASSPDRGESESLGWGLGIRVLNIEPLVALTHLRAPESVVICRKEAERRFSRAPGQSSLFVFGLPERRESFPWP